MYPKRIHRLKNKISLVRSIDGRVVGECVRVCSDCLVVQFYVHQNTNKMVNIWCWWWCCCCCFCCGCYRCCCTKLACAYTSSCMHTHRTPICSTWNFYWPLCKSWRVMLHANKNQTNLTEREKSVAVDGKLFLIQLARNK